MRRIIAAVLLLFVFVGFYGQVHPYYSSIDFSQSPSVVEANLKSLISSTHNPMNYSDTYPWIKLADEDASSISNVILMYNGQSISKNNTIGGGNTSFPEDWNREHIYPQSLINTTATGDLHHLRACDATINGNRGNLPFASGSGSYGTVSGGWYPGDDWKGDVARMIMYIHLRYDEPWTDVGSLSLFLQWNAEDPVSDFERQRNNAIYGGQGNRNPFIDQPYIATFLWGGPPAEDTWGWPNKVADNFTVSLNVYPNPIPNSMDQISITGIVGDLSEVAFYDLGGRMVLTIRQPSVVSQSVSLNVASLQQGVYLMRLRSGSAEVTKKLVLE